MNRWIEFLPLITTAVAAGFAVVLFRHWLQRRQPHLAWWTIGVICFGAGTWLESLVALGGWTEARFKLWYISGALLGAAPLAQGTAYLLRPRKEAHALAVLLILFATTAAICAWRSPIDPNVLQPAVLSGRLFEWQWVRWFSPALNLFALWLLAGGAAWSAAQYRKRQGARARYLGNAFIAIGALLPGVGGTFARYRHNALLYITELIGLVLIAAGYAIIRGDTSESIHGRPSADKPPAQSA